MILVSVPVGKQDVEVAHVDAAVAGDVAGARRRWRGAGAPVANKGAEVRDADDPVVVNVADPSCCKRDTVGKREVAGGEGALVPAGTVELHDGVPETA